MIKKSLEDAINKQINEELYSAYLYFAMAAYFDDIDLMGAANWMNIQVQEELSHVQKFQNYLSERGGRMELDTIGKPQKEWDSPLAVFEAAYAHECKITSCINDLVDLAISEKDHATVNFLQWYVSEQVEEEANAKEIVQQFKLADNNPSALFMIDKELSTRVFTPIVV